MEESWKPAVGFEGRYEVSSIGRVRSTGADRTHGKIIQPFVHPAGYHYVRMYKGGVRHRRRVHRVVARAFIGPPPSEEHEINHLDGNKANNTPSNLEWCTKSENQRHAVRLSGRCYKGENSPASKLAADDVREIRRLAKSGVRQAWIAERYPVSATQINFIIKRKSWRHI